MNTIRILTLSIIISLYLSGCQQFQLSDLNYAQKQTIPPEYQINKELTKEPTTGEFTTEDNKKIAYSLYENKDAKYGIVLLHMLDRTRQDWNKFAKLLQTAGYAVLSIDLRGHGESTKEWKWRAFSDRDFQAMSLDVKGAINFLKTKSINQTVLIGASIGANTALNYGITTDEVKAIVLISAGMDHRTVRIQDALEKNNKPTLLIASKDDLYALTTAQEIYKKAQNKTKDYQYYQDAGHGTKIFDKEKADILILDWLVRNGFR